MVAIYCVLRHSADKHFFLFLEILQTEIKIMNTIVQVILSLLVPSDCTLQVELDTLYWEILWWGIHKMRLSEFIADQYHV